MALPSLCPDLSDPLHFSHKHHEHRDFCRSHGARTHSTIQRILLEKKRAIGAELTAGEILRVEKEVILCCGVFRSPTSSHAFWNWAQG